MTTEFLFTTFDMIGAIITLSKSLEDIRNDTPQYFLAATELIWSGTIASTERLLAASASVTAFIRQWFDVTAEEEEDGSFSLMRCALAIEEQTAFYCHAFDTEVLRKRQDYEQATVRTSQLSDELAIQAEFDQHRQLTALYDSLQSVIEDMIFLLDHAPRDVSSTSRGQRRHQVAAARTPTPTRGGDASQQAEQQDDAELEERKRTLRHNILREILETERAYVQSLELFRKYYVTSLRESLVQPAPLMDSTTINNICDGVEMVLAVNGALLASLEEAFAVDLAEVKVGQVFTTHIGLLALYSQYLWRYSGFQAQFEELMQNKRFQDWLRECATAVQAREKQESPLTIGAYLIKPVQRLPRYELLLVTLLRATAASHHDHGAIKAAAEAVRTANQAINQQRRVQEDMMKVREQFTAIANMPALFDSKSRFVRAEALQGRYHRDLTARMLRLFMFSSVLVITEPSSQHAGHKFNFVEALHFGNVELKDLEEPRLSFELINLSTRRKWRFWARDDEQKRSWLDELDRSIRANAFRGRVASTLRAGPNAIEYVSNEEGQRLLCLTARGLNNPAFWHKMWDNRATGTQYDVSIYRPLPPVGFFIIGDYAEADTNDPLPRRPQNVVVVREDPKNYPLPDGRLPLLAPPVDYVQVWTDSGTGGDFGDICVWTPIAPPGYVALGAITSIHYSSRKPDTEQIRFRCVHESVVTRAAPQMTTGHTGGVLWNYDPPLLRMHKTSTCSFWTVGSTPNFPGSHPPGTFFASRSKDSADRQITMATFRPTSSLLPTTAPK